METDRKMIQSMLLIDDDESIPEIISIIIKKQNPDLIFRICVDGKHALQTLETFKPDLIVADVFMPNMDGITLVNQLFADPVLKLIPVVFFTSATTHKDFEVASRKSNVIGVISKPILPKDFFPQLVAIYHGFPLRKLKNQ